eukprot:TRINITY_DN1488_c0_g1_i6.p1 TRINITY_DN1488_c0_g1~~TRINITY_DN1488_c0_g1_i6.p1  ORF type:complete len:378 (-),score=36.64 TRINITY_DN1488_c0_g1_i6:111-1184(-)
METNSSQVQVDTISANIEDTDLLELGLNLEVPIETPKPPIEIPQPTKKRKVYHQYCEEDRIKIGKYASEFGNTNAIKYFALEFPHLRESTVRGHRKYYFKSLNKQRYQGQKAVSAPVEALKPQPPYNGYQGQKALSTPVEALKPQPPHNGQLTNCQPYRILSLSEVNKNAQRQEDLVQSLQDENKKLLHQIDDGKARVQMLENQINNVQLQLPEQQQDQNQVDIWREAYNDIVQQMHRKDQQHIEEISRLHKEYLEKINRAENSAIFEENKKWQQRLDIQQTESNKLQEEVNRLQDEVRRLESRSQWSPQAHEFIELENKISLVERQFKDKETQWRELSQHQQEMWEAQQRILQQKR